MGQSTTSSKLPYVEKIGEGDPSYMIRTHVTPFDWWKWRRIYLHILGRPDNDRDYHDHPWGFTTIVLFGGYTDISHVLDENGVPTGEVVEDKLGWLSIRHRPATYAHNITKLHTKRVVTLVFRDNQKARHWGFWTQQIDRRVDKGWRWLWVHWRDYVKA